ncbi:hypothetical protein BDN70DRAFT_699897 [Pholiota conissans]|uniref:Uncharacterized protein n=1 Tax=Pholiota conissans TaxID=109636 RepID=A0A9P5Z385_9AGAR|nr:hypothetical protein BDN70DRAFT_699897 [Pholiota conissans]
MHKLLALSATPTSNDQLCAASASAPQTARVLTNCRYSCCLKFVEICVSSSRLVVDSDFDVQKRQADVLRE